MGLAGLLGILGPVAMLLLPDRTPPLRPARSPSSQPEVDAFGPITLDRCPACGWLVPRGEACPECERRRLAPQSHARDLRVIGAIVVGAIPLTVNVVVGLQVAAPAIGHATGDRAAAYNAAAKSLLYNAMTAIESAYIDYGTFAIPEEAVEYIGPSVDFRRAYAHLVPFDGEPYTPTTARAEENEVDYCGDDTGYSVSTISETGTVWAVYVEKDADGGMLFVRMTPDGKVYEGW